jgi:hypothetical protein
MSQITYKAKDGRLMEVDERERVRRTILERSGWVLVEEVEPEPETAEEPTPAAPKPAPKKQVKKATKDK